MTNPNLDGSTHGWIGSYGHNDSEKLSPWKEIPGFHSLLNVACPDVFERVGRSQTNFATSIPANFVRHFLCRVVVAN